MSSIVLTIDFGTVSRSVIKAVYYLSVYLPLWLDQSQIDVQFSLSFRSPFPHTFPVFPLGPCLWVGRSGLSGWGVPEYRQVWPRLPKCQPTCILYSKKCSSHMSNISGYSPVSIFSFHSFLRYTLSIPFPNGGDGRLDARTSFVEPLKHFCQSDSTFVLASHVIWQCIQGLPFRRLAGGRGRVFGWRNAGRADKIFQVSKVQISTIPVWFQKLSIYLYLKIHFFLTLEK